MMLKAFGEFLDFDEEIEVEKQIKLFEDISTTDGDFSYQFTLAKTLNNTRILRNPLPDNISKPVYQRIPASILSETGAETHKGYLRIERVAEEYACSFFAGNNNWFGMITGLLTDLDFSAHDIEQTEVNIIDSWSSNEGIVFPFLDHGGLITRSYPQVKVEDFLGAFYVKTIFTKIFASAGIKIQGELLQDWRFQNMICSSTAKDQDEIDARSSYVQKSATQVVAHNALTKITWDNDSTRPYFDGALNNFDLPNSRYVADVRESVKIDATLVWHTTGFAPFALLFFYVNGVEVRVRGGDGNEDQENVISFQFSLILNAGDVLEVYLQHINSDGDAASVVRGTVKITPLYIYKAFGNSTVPNWTSQQFVSNILKIFNVLAWYDSDNATLTLNLFEKLKSKPALDISPYISETEIDYTEFVSDYGQQSTFAYNEVEFEELKEYNKGKYFKYGQGVIDVDNGFLEERKEVLKSDFSNPLGYVNGVFDAPIEKTNLIELEEGESVTFDDVADDGLGNAAFHLSNEIFLVGDLVRIKDSTNAAYNGDWVVSSIPSGHITLNGIPMDTAASGTIVKLDYKYSSDENVFLFIYVPNYQVTKFAGNSILFDSGTYYPITINNVGYAYFDLIDIGRQVNRDFIYSLSFGNINEPLRYQVTMLDSYFSLFGRVLNDPVKLLNTVQIPQSLYKQIDFLSPVKIRTMETTNEYYLNRITGYKESYLDCTFELIKI